MAKTTKKSLSARNSWALTVLCRLAQAGCVAAFIYGLALFPLLIASFSQWRLNKLPLNELAVDVLRVSVPTWLASAVLIYCEVSLRRDRFMTRMLVLHPDEPWRSNPAWNSIVLQSSYPISWRAFGLALISILVVGVPLAAAFFNSTVPGVLCVVLGVLCVSFSISQWLTRAWAGAELKLITLPGIIGGPFTAVYSMRGEFSPQTLFSASLQCTYRLPHSGSDDSDNARRIHWSSAIELKNPVSTSSGRTELPIHFAIPIECPNSTIEPGRHESMCDVRWEVMVQLKDAAEQGRAKFDVPVFRTRHSRADYQPDEDLLQDFVPSYSAPLVLKKFSFEEKIVSQDCLTMTFRLRDRSIFKMAAYLAAFGAAAILGIVWLVPYVILQIFLGFLPAMILLAVAFNLVEDWLWRGTIIREHEKLTIDCGIRYYHAPLHCLANSETKLCCKVGMQSQNQILESWNLSINLPTGEERLLFRQMGSRGEVEAVQTWLAARLGIGKSHIG